MKKMILSCATILLSVVTGGSFAEPKMHYGTPRVPKNKALTASVNLGPALQIRNFSHWSYDVYTQQNGYAEQGPLLIYPVDNPPYNQITLEAEYPQVWLSWPIRVEIDDPSTRNPIFLGYIQPTNPIVDIRGYANKYLKSTSAAEKTPVHVIVHP